MYWFHLSVGWYISQLTEQALFGQYNNLKTPSWTCIKLGSKEDKLYDFEIKDRQYTGFFSPKFQFFKAPVQFFGLQLNITCMQNLRLTYIKFGILLWNEDDSMVIKSRVEKIDIGKYCLFISWEHFA